MSSNTSDQPGQSETQSVSAIIDDSNTNAANTGTANMDTANVGAILQTSSPGGESVTRDEEDLVLLLSQFFQGSEGDMLPNVLQLPEENPVLAEPPMAEEALMSEELPMIEESPMAEEPSMAEGLSWSYEPPLVDDPRFTEDPPIAEDLSWIDSDWGERAWAGNPSSPVPAWDQLPTVTPHPAFLDMGPDPTLQIYRDEPISHDEIMRRAQRAVEAEIDRRLREPSRGPVRRARRAASLLVAIGERHHRRRITIPLRELQFFAMVVGVERVQQEIDLICAGDDNTNGSGEKN